MNFLENEVTQLPFHEPMMSKCSCYKLV